MLHRHMACYADPAPGVNHLRVGSVQFGLETRGSTQAQHSGSEHRLRKQNLQLCGTEEKLRSHRGVADKGDLVLCNTRSSVPVPETNDVSESTASLLMPAGCAFCCVLCTLHVPVSSKTTDLSAEPLKRASPKALN